MLRKTLWTKSCLILLVLAVLVAPMAGSLTVLVDGPPDPDLNPLASQQMTAIRSDLCLVKQGIEAHNKGGRLTLQGLGLEQEDVWTECDDSGLELLMIGRRIKPGL